MNGGCNDTDTDKAGEEGAPVGEGNSCIHRNLREPKSEEARNDSSQCCGKSSQGSCGDDKRPRTSSEDANGGEHFTKTEGGGIGATTDRDGEYGQGE